MSLVSEETRLVFYAKLVLFIADVAFLIGIKDQVADRSDQTVDAKGDHGEEDVRAGSAGVALGLLGSVIDDQTTDPAQEKG